MDYYHILLYSDNLHLLKQVCIEFHVLLQSKTFWKERSKKEAIEPEVTCLQEWLQHREGLRLTLLEGSFSNMVPINSLPKRVLEFMELGGVKLAEIKNTKLELVREGENSWSLRSITSIKKDVNCTILLAKLNEQEKQSLIYRVKRGICVNLN
ncbi:Hypothetical protein BRZCDTV_124 [Brazilian cedratvirus IHUMI]|uniref:Uncharacterized protein n=1 Tax=Brazilian cedratvirus IHUMI TaxID=2126980 RepID=A0A2R8FDD9_9VIRU|nr:Hypothetical protein BRZCDTV_124 [Brazilian cedratvirus IHUMI]